MTDSEKSGRKILLATTFLFNGGIGELILR